MSLPPDFYCHACQARPARHEDLCDVCEADAQRSDLLQIDARMDEVLMVWEAVA